MTKTNQTLSNIAATDKPVFVAHPRPFQTFYYESSTPNLAVWQRTSRSCTRYGAVRAAVMRLLDGRSKHADVYDIAGVRVAYMTRKGNRITIVCV